MEYAHWTSIIVELCSKFILIRKRAMLSGSAKKYFIIIFGDQIILKKKIKKREIFSYVQGVSNDKLKEKKKTSNRNNCFYEPKNKQLRKNA